MTGQLGEISKEADWIKAEMSDKNTEMTKKQQEPRKLFVMLIQSDTELRDKEMVRKLKKLGEGFVMMVSLVTDTIWLSLMLSLKLRDRVQVR
ncbi:hypothetical protein N7448_001864 [Penicillium atrosanguineum]|uniref:Uncharacterized protein n=1 Tax=Penicillium atrosanguineum TaxID=1132637 RepID=A0A9W9LDL5_9EURO|nr:uncharacterized protein N7443_005262 [Penicillium atrosanguineum]KAJ5133107.1 hypothetical protein N7526_004472 [Penicillium atrosanguineum]KAJ5150286.1 hypothetical protein N7448_001864 [Penicillium atrosanguineum]KAJ5305602.1 hypothetical protein N7443_005262 [Penicillium atrosanguineum]KAJ5325064.1 hypothetical protein N7476_003664 [Penicillium atrosanguineum]